jgi:hypothetical protein
MGAAGVLGRILKSDFADHIFARLSLRSIETFEKDGFAECRERVRWQA